MYIPYSKVACIDYKHFSLFVTHSSKECYFTDIDECAGGNPCGRGTCLNNNNGTFYECDCPPGDIENGVDDTLTCVGKLTIYIVML